MLSDTSSQSLYDSHTDKHNAINVLIPPLDYTPPKKVSGFTPSLDLTVGDLSMDLLDAHKTAMQRLWIGFKRSIHHPADNYTLIQQLDEKLNYYHAIILAVKTDTREPVGFATLNRLDNQTLEYSSAYVKHECRQQGILDGMTEEIMRIADVEKRTGAEYIVADLISDQLPVRFLTDRGFEIEEGPSELPDAIPLRRRL